MIIKLPSMVKVDVSDTFNFVENSWGSKGLMALVVYGSASKPAIKRFPVTRKFIFWEYQTYEDRRIEPNDVDVAAIYSTDVNLESVQKNDSCRLMKKCQDDYSAWWVDTSRFLNLHAMCISYDLLLEKKNEDKNLEAVLKDGIIIWGNLPRPMRRA